MEINIYSTIIFIIIIIEFSLAIVIFYGSKHVSAKAFTFLVFLHTLWIFNQSAFHGTTDPEIAKFLINTAHYLGGILAAAFFYFTLIFSKGRHPNWKIFASMVLLQIILLPLYKNGLIIGDIFPEVGHQQWKWGWGKLWFVFHFIFLGFWISGLYVLYNNFRKSLTVNVRNNSLYVLLTMIISVTPVAIITVILPSPVFGIYKYGWLGTAVSLGWVSILAYLIIKRRQMNIRAILAEIFVLAAAIILLVNIFIDDTTFNDEAITSGTIIRTVIFLSFSIVGYLLIIKILKESEQKEKIESLNNQMKRLNDELEKNVQNRTEKLKTSKKHIETILENLTLGIIEYDPDFTISQLNKTAEQLLGVKREDVVDKKISMGGTEKLSSLSTVVFGGRTKKGILDFSEQSVDYKEVTIKYPKRKELQVITVPIRKIPFVKISGFVKLLRDVTHEKAVAQGKDEFISIVAHQLNAPLQATQWSLETVIEETTNEKQKEFLNKAYNTNKNLIQITNDLLVATQIDSDEFNFNFKKDSVVKIITDQIQKFKKTAEEKGLRLIFKNNKPDIPKFILDPGKISIVLKNIIENAVDYTPKGGSVTVTLDTLNNGNAAITIVDTGIGIAKEDLKQIFTKFHRSKQALLMETDRSGLGLYITKKIIDGHKGIITIKSKEGEGVKVQIQLPILNALPDEK